ncbi:hypothetical protein E4U17_001281 [Claviceps sp. LM77 group G4]|nr:hypothetical protein E4U17_001281 [Claviceps sp. LM77 group G4]
MSAAATDTGSPRPRVKLPPMGEVGMYDGTEPAQRWLKRLEVLFAGANDGESVDASTFIKIIDVSLTRSAAAFADSSAHLREIMKRAGEGNAVDADLDVVKRLFQDKYPLTFLPEERDQPINPELRQGETEVLEAYYSRCQSLVVRSGGRDKPLDPLDKLSQAEGYILRDFIFKFVNGLYDKDLMQEAISHSALAVDSLRQAMDIVTRAAGILSAKATSAKLSARDTRTALMEELITSHLGCSADEALSRTYQLPPGFMETFGRNGQPTPASVNTLLTQLQPSITQFRNSARSYQATTPQQLEVVPVHQNHRVVPVYQNQVAPPAYQNHQVAPAQPIQHVAPVNQDQQVAAPYRDPYRPRQPRPYQQRENPAWRQPDDTVVTQITHARPSLRPARESTNPYINGTIPLPRGVVCYRCGIDGHIAAECTEQNNLLRKWEVAWLRSMSVPPVRDDGTWVPGRVNARLAHIYLERDATNDDEPEDATDTGVVARYVAVEPRSEPLDSECQQLVRYGELIRARPTKACTEEVDARRASMQPRVEEVTDEEDGAAPLQPLLTSLRRAEQSTLETVAQGALWVMTLLSEAEPHPKKRKGMPIDELSSEETEQIGPAPLVREETIRKNARVLSQIWGRRGLGPIDWQELAGRISVPMSLLDLWQISPELSRQFRKLSSRVTAPRKRSGKKVSFAFEEKSVGLASGVKRKARVKKNHNTELLRKHGPGTKLFGISVSEVSNRILQAVLNKTVEHPLDWDLQLPKVVSVLNSRFIKSVGYSPIEVLYGLTRRLPTGFNLS